MAVEDLDWVERYGDQTYKARSLDAVRVAIFALHFSHLVVIPSLAVRLALLNGAANMLGYCLAAVCIGELVATPFMGAWYNRRPARQVVTFALVVNLIGSLVYAIAPDRITILISRLVVGFAAGANSPLLTLTGALTNKYNRSEILGTIRMMYVLAFIVGAGLSSTASFTHMNTPGIPLTKMQHSIPTYVQLGEQDISRAMYDSSNFSNFLVKPSVQMAAVDIWSMHYLGMSNLTEVGVATRYLTKEMGNTGSVLGDMLQANGNSPTAYNRTRRLLAFGAATRMPQGGVVQVRLMTLLAASDAANSSASSSNATQNETQVQEDIIDEEEPDSVETDYQLGRDIGNQDFYLPGYWTALVSHGLAAPGYMAAVVNSFSIVWVWFRLQEGPRKALSQSVPFAHLYSRSFSYFMPLVACVALESLAQVALVSIETLVAPIVRIWGGFTCDAMAIFMMGLAASGVVGLALVDLLRRRTPVRRLIFLASSLVTLGFLICIPWLGNPRLLFYALGACLTFAALVPLSEMTSQIVESAIVKVYSEDGEVAWLQLFWFVTRVPARVVGPVMLALGLQSDPTGATVYIGLSIFGVLALSVFVVYHRKLISPQVGEDAQVLPGADPSIETDDVIYGPLTQN